MHWDLKSPSFKDETLELAGIDCSSGFHTSFENPLNYFEYWQTFEVIEPKKKMVVLPVERRQELTAQLHSQLVTEIKNKIISKPI